MFIFTIHNNKTNGNIIHYFYSKTLKKDNMSISNQGRTLLQFFGGLKSPHISRWGAKLSRLIFEKIAICGYKRIFRN